MSVDQKNDMPEKRKFDVRLDPGALEEYKGLDNSLIEIVNKKIDELEFRADEIGKKKKSPQRRKILKKKIVNNITQIRPIYANSRNAMHKHNIIERTLS